VPFSSLSLSRVFLFDFNFEVSQHLLLVELDEAAYSIKWNSFLTHPEVDSLGLYAQPLGYVVCCDQAFLHFSRNATFADPFPSSQVTFSASKNGFDLFISARVFLPENCIEVITASVWHQSEVTETKAPEWGWVKNGSVEMRRSRTWKKNRPKNVTDSSLDLMQIDENR
jgi:hypothetical protein